MKTELQNAEILRALELLLLFDVKHPRMSIKEIMGRSGSLNIPPILRMLQILEERDFLERMLFSGKTFWGITSLGRKARNQIEKIIDAGL